MKLKFGIVICEGSSPALRRLGIRSSARLYEEWMAKQAKQASFRTYLAHSGRVPVKVDECDAYIISGSQHNIADKLDWQLALFNFLRKTAKAQIPVVGIGFGNQAVAHALGGRTGPVSGGWSIGRKTWKLVRDEGWLAVPNKQLSLYSFSRNQVVKLPSRSLRVVSSTNYPNAAFRVANHSVGIHGHPEYTSEIVEALLDIHADEIPAKIATAARTSLENKQTDADSVGKWVLHFAYRG